MKVQLALTSAEKDAARTIAVRFLLEMVKSVELKDGKLDAPSQHDIERAASDLVGEMFLSVGVKANG